MQSDAMKEEAVPSVDIQQADRETDMSTRHLSKTHEIHQPTVEESTDTTPPKPTDYVEVADGKESNLDQPQAHGISNELGVQKPAAVGDGEKESSSPVEEALKGEVTASITAEPNQGEGHNTAAQEEDKEVSGEPESGQASRPEEALKGEVVASITAAPNQGEGHNTAAQEEQKEVSGEPESGQSSRPEATLSDERPEEASPRKSNQPDRDSFVANNTLKDGSDDFKPDGNPVDLNVKTADADIVTADDTGKIKVKDTASTTVEVVGSKSGSPDTKSPRFNEEDLQVDAFQDPPTRPKEIPEDLKEVSDSTSRAGTRSTKRPASPRKRHKIELADGFEVTNEIDNTKKAASDIHPLLLNAPFKVAASQRNGSGGRPRCMALDCKKAISVEGKEVGLCSEHFNFLILNTPNKFKVDDVVKVRGKRGKGNKGGIARVARLDRRVDGDTVALTYDVQFCRDGDERLAVPEAMIKLHDVNEAQLEEDVKEEQKIKGLPVEGVLPRSRASKSKAKKPARDHEVPADESDKLTSGPESNGTQGDESQFDPVLISKRGKQRKSMAKAKEPAREQEAPVGEPDNLSSEPESKITQGEELQSDPVVSKRGRRLKSMAKAKKPAREQEAPVGEPDNLSSEPESKGDASRSGPVVSKRGRRLKSMAKAKKPAREQEAPVGEQGELSSGESGTPESKSKQDDMSVERVVLQFKSVIPSKKGRRLCKVEGCNKFSQSSATGMCFRHNKLVTKEGTEIVEASSTPEHVPNRIKQSRRSPIADPKAKKRKFEEDAVSVPAPSSKRSLRGQDRQAKSKSRERKRKDDGKHLSTAPSRHSKRSLKAQPSYKEPADDESVEIISTTPSPKKQTSGKLKAKSVSSPSSSGVMAPSSGGTRRSRRTPIATNRYGVGNDSSDNAVDDGKKDDGDDNEDVGVDDNDGSSVDELAEGGKKAEEDGKGVKPRRMSASNWSQAEDEILLRLMSNKEHKKRTQWTVMANEIPGKTATQLRWRWNTICPDRSGMPWSSEEDDKLIAFQQTNGNNWVKCADVLPGRTNIDVEARWKLLVKSGEARNSSIAIADKPDTVDSKECADDTSFQVDEKVTSVNCPKLDEPPIAKADEAPVMPLPPPAKPEKHDPQGKSVHANDDDDDDFSLSDLDPPVFAPRTREHKELRLDRMNHTTQEDRWEIMCRPKKAPAGGVIATTSPPESRRASRVSPELERSLLERTRFELLAGNDYWMCTTCAIGVPSLSLPCGSCRQYISFVPLTIPEFDDWVKNYHEKHREKALLWRAQWVEKIKEVKKEWSPKDDTQANGSNKKESKEFSVSIDFYKRGRYASSFCRYTNCTAFTGPGSNGFCAKHNESLLAADGSGVSPFPFVLPEDRKYCTLQLYLSLEQCVPCDFGLTENQRAQNVGVGYPGLMCKHCSNRTPANDSGGKAHRGRWFPSSESAVNTASFSNSLVAHMKSCAFVPAKVKQAILEDEKATTEPDAKPRIGTGRRKFFRRLWCRIQRVDGADSKETADAAGKKRKNITDVDEERPIKKIKAKKANRFEPIEKPKKSASRCSLDTDMGDPDSQLKKRKTSQQ